MAKLICPVCQQTFDSEKTQAMPFCSVRCKYVDLGKWLNEEYGLPVEPDESPSTLENWDGNGNGSELPD